MRLYFELFVFILFFREALFQHSQITKNFPRLTTRGQKNIEQAHVQQNSQRVLVSFISVLCSYLFMHQVTKCLVYSVRVSRINRMLGLL